MITKVSVGKHANSRGPKSALQKVQDRVDAGLDVFVSDQRPILNAEEGLRWGNPDEVREVLGSFGAMLLDPTIGAYPWQLKWIGEAFVRIGQGEDAELVLGLKKNAGRSASLRSDRLLMNQFAQLTIDKKLSDKEAIAVIALKNLTAKYAGRLKGDKSFDLPKHELTAEEQRVGKHLRAATKRWRARGRPSAAIPKKK